MTKDDFIGIVEKTSFDAGTKALLLTSFCIGYDQGKVDALKEVIQRMDSYEIKKASLCM